MAKQIVWSPLSEMDFARILEYLNENWDEKVVNQFVDIIENSLNQIAINPKQFPVVHKKKRIRKCVLTKHNTLFYRDSKQQIDVLRIFDTRQNPNNLSFK
jgi:plasmid stabilization system protein ParE